MGGWDVRGGGQGAGRPDVRRPDFVAAALPDTNQPAASASPAAGGWLLPPCRDILPSRSGRAQCACLQRGLASIVACIWHLDGHNPEPMPAALQHLNSICLVHPAKEDARNQFAHSFLHARDPPACCPVQSSVFWLKHKRVHISWVSTGGCQQANMAPRR